MVVLSPMVLFSPTVVLAPMVDPDPSVTDAGTVALVWTHASPKPSEFASSWLALAMPIQLSMASSTVSLSASAANAAVVSRTSKPSVRVLNGTPSASRSHR